MSSIWLVIMEDEYYVYAEGDAAMVFVETFVAEGLDMTLDQMAEAGWEWVVPLNNPEGEIMYFLSVKRPSLRAQVIRMPVLQGERWVGEHRGRQDPGQ